MIPQKSNDRQPNPADAAMVHHECWTCQTLGAFHGTESDYLTPNQTTRPSNPHAPRVADEPDLNSIGA
jgi:hypothetical protein